MNKLRIKHVYFLYDRNDNLVKIGTSFKPIERKKTLESPYQKYELLYVFTGGGRRKEKEFHIRFKKYRYKYEWFRYTNELKDFIDILKNNKLVWIGQDVSKIPKNTMSIGFLTDDKTFDKINELAKISGRSVHGMTNYCMKLIARNEKLNLIKIISSNEYINFYNMKCNRIEKELENIKKIIYLRELVYSKKISTIGHIHIFKRDFLRLIAKLKYIFKI